MSANGKTIFITSADAKYFDLVQGAVRSIREAPAGKDVAIGFLDGGCTQEQLAWLAPLVDAIVAPNWDIPHPLNADAPRYMRNLLARPFLRKHFHDYEVYIWIDADAWIQDWEAIKLFDAGARRRKGLAIVPEIDRGHAVRYHNFGAQFRSWHQLYETVMDSATAERMAHAPMLNAGVFALHVQAPHWDRWAARLESCLRTNYSLYSDQVALNLAVYNDELFERTEMLPAWCNWTCHSGMPAWDEERQAFVEPYLPCHKIGILHLTDAKPTWAFVPNLQGLHVHRLVRYPSGAAPF